MSVTSMNQLIQFPIHRDQPATSLTLSSNTTFLILGLMIHFSLFQILLARKRVFGFLLASKSPQIVEKRTINTARQPGHLRQTLVLSQTDMKIVLRSLGMVSGERLPSRLDSSDMFDMFEVKNPGLEEVKEAFDVFDDDKNGFIDAYDLQKAMQRLGLREGMELGNCRRMIGLFDENGDGRLDFQEFVKFMENTFN